MASPALFQLIVKNAQRVSQEKDKDMQLYRQQRLTSFSTGIQSQQQERLLNLRFENDKVLKNIAQKNALDLQQMNRQIQLDAKQQIADMAIKESRRAYQEQLERQKTEWRDVGTQLMGMAELEKDPLVKSNMERMGTFAQTGQDPSLMKGFQKKVLSASERKAQREEQDALRLDKAVETFSKYTTEQLEDPKFQREAMKLMKGAGFKARTDFQKWVKESVTATLPKKMPEDIKISYRQVNSLQIKMIGKSQEELEKYKKPYNTNVKLVNDWYKKAKRKERLPLLEEIPEDQSAFGKLWRRMFGGDKPTKLELTKTPQTPEERFNELVKEGKLSEDEVYAQLIEEGYK